jgi:hypothetical protein
MINDAKKARKARENGKLGGNPKLRKQKDNSGSDNQEDNGGDKPQKPEARVQKKTSSKDDAKKTALPSDFKPAQFGDGSKSRAIVDGWSKDHLKIQIEGFAAHHRKVGSKFSDWQAAWSTWVLNSEKFARERHHRLGEAAGGGGFLDHFLEHEAHRYEGINR